MHLIIKLVEHFSRMGWKTTKLRIRALGFCWVFCLCWGLAFGFVCFLKQDNPWNIKERNWIVSEKQETLAKYQENLPSLLSNETSLVYSLIHKMWNAKTQLDKPVKYVRVSRIQKVFWSNFKYMGTYWIKGWNYTSYEEEKNEQAHCLNISYQSSLFHKHIIFFNHRTVQYTRIKKEKYEKVNLKVL